MTYSRRAKRKLDFPIIAGGSFLVVWMASSVSLCLRDCFQNLLWLCNVSILAAAVGLFLRSSLIVTAQVVLTLIYHVFWNLDFWLYFFSSYSLIGANRWIFDSELLLVEKVTAFYIHVFMAPLCLASLASLGASTKGWLLASMQTFVVFILTILFTTPEYNINWLHRVILLNLDLSSFNLFFYYVLILMVPSLLIYWPTNKLLVWIFEKTNRKVIS